VNFLKRLFGRNDDDEGEDLPITLDVERRRAQLLRLEQALDALATEMRAEQSMDNPGWRGDDTYLAEPRRCLPIAAISGDVSNGRELPDIGVQRGEDLFGPMPRS